MKEAAKEAEKGIRKNHGGPFGVVIVRKGKVIAKCHNTVVKSKDPTAHAEINAIRLASKKLKKFHLSDCEIYTSCEPCPMCLSAIHWARIKRVYYGCTRKDAKKIGFDDSIFYKQLEKAIKGKDPSLKKLGRAECLKVFELWAQKKDKINY